MFYCGLLPNKCTQITKDYFICTKASEVTMTHLANWTSWIHPNHDVNREKQSTTKPRAYLYVILQTSVNREIKINLQPYSCDINQIVTRLRQCVIGWYQNLLMPWQISLPRHQLIYYCCRIIQLLLWFFSETPPILFIAICDTCC